MFQPMNYGGLLNDQEQRGARNNLLLNFGLGLLSQSGPSPTKIGLGQAIGAAGMGALNAQQGFINNLVQNRMMKQKFDEAEKEKQREEYVKGLVGSRATAPTANASPSAGTGLLGDIERGDPNAMRNYYTGLLGAGGDYTKLGLAGLTGAGSELPADVRTWNFFKKLTPKEQARFIEMKRSPNIMNLGGSMAVRAPGGGLGEVYAVTPKPSEMPTFKGEQARAEATAKADVEREADATKKAMQAGNIEGLIKEADTLLNDATGSAAGAALSLGKRAIGMSDKTTQANQQLKLISGWLVSNVPRMEGPQSEFDVKNYQLMAGMVGDELVPIEDRRAALNALLRLQKKYSFANPGSQNPQNNQNGIQFLGFE